MRTIPKMLLMLALATTFAAAGADAGPPPLERVPLMEQAVAPVQTVATVKAARITFAPGQSTGRHRHPVPVVGVVTEGSFVFKVQGQPERVLHQGDTFYEPKHTIIERFDNASRRSPATITGFYLADRLDRPLIEMLPP